MASVDDLLRRMHRQAFALRPTGDSGRQLEAQLCAWVPLATNASRVLEALDPRPGQDPDLYALLRSVSRAPTGRLQRADPRLTALALTVGVLGDVVTSFPTIVAESGQAQRSRLQASIRAALYAAARTTLDVARAAREEPRAARLVREIAESTELAALLPPAARVSTLERLTVTRPTPSTVDGAVQLWAVAAQRTFTSYQLLTGVALQDAAATLSLLTRITAETLHEAASRRILDPEAGTQSARVMAAASSAWRAAAAWPSNIQLGGRAHEHHRAARMVRDAITGPQLSRLTLREKVVTLRSAVDTATAIGELQANTVRWLVSRGGLWMAHERANLRPPGVERRHIKLDWEAMPCDHAAGLILAHRAHEARIALDEAAVVVNQALGPASRASGVAGPPALVGNRLAWEVIDPTKTVHQALAALPEMERGPRIAR